MMQNGMETLLDVRDLTVGFDTDEGALTAVDGVSFSVKKGGRLGIVGESGCGKSVTAFSIMRLLPHPSGKILGGSVVFDGVDLTTLPDEKMRALRGRRIAMIYQEPMSALNPVQTIGRQLAEAILLHEKLPREEVYDRCVKLLGKVGISSPEKRMAAYPHQLSGGMRQRVMIAMALGCKPDLLIADEPTTALDVTIQAQILELIRSLQEETGMALILITHSLGVVVQVCDEVAVMYAGRIAERGSVTDIFDRPAHLYTRGLMDSIPRLEQPHKMPLPTIPGMVPCLKDLPVGARFAPRSPHPKAADYIASDAYKSIRPPLVEISPGHWVEDCEVVRCVS
jgi:oligopeptide/dipeptide ABC transporter ATP-binding protein